MEGKLMQTEGKPSPRFASSIWDHLSLLLKWRKLLFIVMTIAIIGSVVYSLTLQKWYNSESIILPPPASSMGVGSFLPNLNLGVLGGIGVLPDEIKLIVTLLSSRRLKDTVIDEFNWMEYHELKYRAKAYLLFDHIVHWEVSEEGALKIAVEEKDPERAMKTVNFITNFLKEEYNRITVEQAGSQRQFIENRLNEVYAELSTLEDSLVSYHKKEGIVAVPEQIEATIKSLAELQTEQILAEVQYEVLKNTMPADASMVVQAKENMNALKRELNRITKDSDKSLSDIYINLEKAPEYALVYLRMERNLLLFSKVLEFLQPQYEQARIAEKREVGNLYVLDVGRIPEKKSKPKRAFVVLGLSGVIFLLTYFYILFVEWLSIIRSVDRERYELVNRVLTGLKPKKLFDFRE